MAIALDTPGGHLEATREIVQRMLASDVPIVVWVGPAGARAGSAGVFITLAADVAAMHPASNIGAAHAVLGGGEDVEKQAGKEMARKIENDTAAFARSIAAARGRNADWAEKAVRESVSATAEEARTLRVIDVVAPDLQSALAFAEGRTASRTTGAQIIRARDATLTPADMTVRQRTLAFLSDPNVIAILMMLGTLGLALEFYHPGGIVPGALGAFFLLLAFLSMKVIPVNAGALVLILAGVALLVVEGFVTTHGIAGLAGAALLAIGALFFIDKSSAEYRFDPALLTPLPVGGLAHAHRARRPAGLRGMEGGPHPPREAAAGRAGDDRRGGAGDERRRPRRRRGLRALRPGAADCRGCARPPRSSPATRCAGVAGTGTAATALPMASTRARPAAASRAGIRRAAAQGSVVGRGEGHSIHRYRRGGAPT